jgi:hypothetical protein
MRLQDFASAFALHLFGDGELLQRSVDLESWHGYVHFSLCLHLYFLGTIHCRGAH